MAKKTTPNDRKITSDEAKSRLERAAGVSAEATGEHTYRLQAASAAHAEEAAGFFDEIRERLHLEDPIATPDGAGGLTVFLKQGASKILDEIEEYVDELRQKIKDRISEAVEAITGRKTSPVPGQPGTYASEAATPEAAQEAADIAREAGVTALAVRADSRAVHFDLGTERAEIEEVLERLKARQAEFRRAADGVDFGEAAETLQDGYGQKRPVEMPEPGSTSKVAKVHLESEAEAEAAVDYIHNIHHENGRKGTPAHAEGNVVVVDFAVNPQQTLETMREVNQKLERGADEGRPSGVYAKADVRTEGQPGATSRARGA